MEYKSEWNRPKKHEYAQGGFKKVIDVYEDLLNPKTGKMETKVTDKVHVYEKIQSHKDAQELESIIKRYEIDIDKNQIKEINDDIIDMTAIPETMTEAYSMIKQVENEFNERPAEIKKAFNNNVGEYVAGIQNGKLREVVTAYENKNKKVKAPQGQTLEELNKKVQAPVQAQVQKQVPEISQEQISAMVQEQINKTIQGGNVNV